MDRGTLIVIALITIVSMIAYGNSHDEEVLYVMFTMIFALISLPRFFDYLKTRGETGSAKTAIPEDSSVLKERLENLENLVCRLDTEMNYQLERTLSEGKLTTGMQSVEEAPTTYLHVAANLESRYQILKEIGRGGMGIVFQAYDKQLKEQVAIKILSPLLSGNQDALERLKREVSAARKISHDNVIRIFDISSLNGLDFVSMEYFAGTSLKEYMRRSGGLSFMEGANIAMQICEGMEAAHKQGVVHRDLKSQNIIINTANQIKIIDFGLARTIQAEGLTATGLIMGTPEYMAPEQVAGKKVDERADIYSLGVILFELFTGSVPFSGDSAIAVGFKQIKEEPKPPRTINSQIPEELSALILKSLQKDPSRRFRSVNELRREMEKIFSSQEIPTQFGGRQPSLMEHEKEKL